MASRIDAFAMPFEFKPAILAFPNVFVVDGIGVFSCDFDPSVFEMARDL